MSKQEPMPKEVQDAVNNLDAAAENRMGPQTTRKDYRLVVDYIYAMRAEQEVHDAFYNLTVKERDYERGRYDRLKATVDRAVDHGHHISTNIERDMATLNDRLQKLILRLEQSLPGQSRFVGIHTAEFARELLAILRGTS